MHNEHLKYYVFFLNTSIGCTVRMQKNCLFNVIKQSTLQITPSFMDLKMLGLNVTNASTAASYDAIQKRRKKSPRIFYNVLA